MGAEYVYHDQISISKGMGGASGNIIKDPGNTFYI